MRTFSRNFKRHISKKGATDTAASIAGVTAAASVVTGAAATAAAPTGLSALAVAIGIASPPLIVTAAPIVAGLSTVAITAAGVIRFHAWCKSDITDREPDKGDVGEPDGDIGT